MLGRPSFIVGLCSRNACVCFVGYVSFFIQVFNLIGIGIPLFAYRILKKNQKAFENAEFKTKYGFLYDGYKLEKYYWYQYISFPHLIFNREFIILYRKVIMIFISVFMVTYGTQIQALAVLGVSFLSYILHMKGKPFQEDDLNSMEKKALINATITLYCGIYYITGKVLMVDLDLTFF